MSHHKNILAKNRHQQGVTLIEALIVMAIIGILLGMFGMQFMASIRNAQLREAATQFTADIIQARSKAQRESVDYQLRWGTGTSGDYSIGAVTAPTLKKRNLPHGVTITCTQGCEPNDLTYTSPHSEVARSTGLAGGTLFTLTSPHKSIGTYQVKIMGVTGKVLMEKVN